MQERVGVIASSWPTSAESMEEDAGKNNYPRDEADGRKNPPVSTEIQLINLAGSYDTTTIESQSALAMAGGPCV